MRLERVQQSRSLSGSVIVYLNHITPAQKNYHSVAAIGLTDSLSATLNLTYVLRILKS
jgi:hypothetical protein